MNAEFYFLNGDGDFEIRSLSKASSIMCPVQEAMARVRA